MAEYGLQIKNTVGGTIFNSDKTGIGSYVKQLGSTTFSGSVTYGTDEFLVFKVSGFSNTQSSGNKRWITSFTTFSSGNFTTTFRAELGSGGSGIDYAVVDKISSATSSGVYGIRCIVPDGSGAIITFDSSRFPDQPQFVVDGNSVFGSSFQHGQYLAAKSNYSDAFTDIYYSAAPLDFTSIGAFQRKFGFLWNGVTNGVTAYNSPTGSFFNNILGNSTGGGVVICNEVASGISPVTYSHPNSLQPFFFGRLEED
jgi:hypothetical protein